MPKKKPASSPGSLKLKRPAAAVPPVATPKKAAAKVKAKAKAKSSSAKGKGKVAGLKRPAAKAEEEPEAKKKKGGSRKVDTEWCKGLAKTEREHQGETEEQEKGEEEEEETTEDPSVDPGDAFAVASAEDEGTKNRSKHAKVPQAVERQPPAGRKTCAQHREAHVKEIMATYTAQESKEKEKSLPKRLLMGKYNMDEDPFNQTLAEGDIEEVVLSSGKVQYSFVSAEHSTTRGKRSESSSAAQQEVTSKDNAKKWAIGLFTKPRGSASTSGKSKAVKAGPQPLSLDCALNAEQWTQAVQQLTLGMAAFDKVSSTAKRKLLSLGNNKQDSLWPTLHLACIGTGRLELEPSNLLVRFSYSF